MNTVPERMKAVEIAQPGAPEVLRLTERPVPKPGENEVLIKVAAAGVNRPDVEQRKGGYPPPPGASDIPGLEIAGTIVAIGSNVDANASGFKLGEMVCALVTGGGYAEYCNAPVPQCLPVPKGLSLVEAAALPETFFTVWHNIFDRAHLQAGESILIHGGSSGIGTTAIQLAKAFGAKVFTTAGSDDKVAACTKLGADRAINYKTADFVEIVKAETGGKGVNVVLDMLGASYFQKNISCLAVEGRMAMIGLLGGRETTVNLGLLLMKRLMIGGSALRPRSIAEKGAMAKSLREKVWPLIEAGRVKPVMDSTMPLAEAVAAHARMESSAHIGKIVLIVA